MRPCSDFHFRIVPVFDAVPLEGSKIIGNIVFVFWLCSLHAQISQESLNILILFIVDGEVSQVLTILHGALFQN